MAGCFNVNVAAIAVGQISHLLNRVLALRIDAYVRAAPLSHFDPLVAQIQRHDDGGAFHLCRRNHTQSKGSASGNDDRVLVLNVSALNCMN
jgi:hypothetical protein